MTLLWIQTHNRTLAKIATEQQKAMEHIQKLLDKSDDLLGAEMTRSESLIEDIKKSSC